MNETNRPADTVMLRERIAGPTPAPLLVTVKQACRMLGISRTTLHHLVRKGEVKQLRIGSAVRYSVDHLREFANSAQQVDLCRRASDQTRGDK